MRDSTPLMPDDTLVHGANTGVDIRRAAMNLLARREHSISELRRKLQRSFSDQSQVEAQLWLLAGEGLQSDLRFAQSYARQRISRGYGPLRLREELRERGVSAEDAAAAIAALDVDWCAIAARVLGRKFGAGDAADVNDKARRARFMQYRGFAREHYQKQLLD